MSWSTLIMKILLKIENCHYWWRHSWRHQILWVSVTQRMISNSHFKLFYFTKHQCLSMNDFIQFFDERYIMSEYCYEKIYRNHVAFGGYILCQCFVDLCIGSLHWQTRVILIQVIHNWHSIQTVLMIGTVYDAYTRHRRQAIIDFNDIFFRLSGADWALVNLKQQTNMRNYFKDIHWKFCLWLAIIRMWGPGSYHIRVLTNMDIRGSRRYFRHIFTSIQFLYT